MATMVAPTLVAVQDEAAVDEELVSLAFMLGPEEPVPLLHSHFLTSLLVSGFEPHHVLFKYP